MVGLLWKPLRNLITPGRPYLRRDIRDLKNNFPDQWNLFILATRAFRQIDASDPLSSYQILGMLGFYYPSCGLTAGEESMEGLTDHGRRQWASPIVVGRAIVRMELLSS